MVTEPGGPNYSSSHRRVSAHHCAGSPGHLQLPGSLAVGFLDRTRQESLTEMSSRARQVTSELKLLEMEVKTVRALATWISV